MEFTNLFGRKADGYTSRIIELTESAHAKKTGVAMSATKKSLLETVLTTTSAFYDDRAKAQGLKESVDGSAITQGNAFGDYKVFSAQVGAAVFANLIASELVITKPMTSRTGYLRYTSYVAGTNKGQTKAGDLFSNPWGLGKVNPDYTGNHVVENAVGDGTKVAFDVLYAPTSVEKITVNGVEVAVTDFTVAGNVITFTTAPAADAVIKIGYVYDNEVLPQENLPTLVATDTGITLEAKVRRIAIYYDALAAFDAKQAYGEDLPKNLREQAVSELSREIDTEVTNLLIDNADVDASLLFSQTKPVDYYSVADYYNSFGVIVSRASSILYKRTQRFNATYMLASSDILPILGMTNGFKAASQGNNAGPFFAGTFQGIKIYVLPQIQEESYLVGGVSKNGFKLVFGVNGSDLKSSAAVFAPYMSIVPSQMLQTADMMVQQGWATLYDVELLNKNLLVAGLLTA
jgi:hypothetical protein